MGIVGYHRLAIWGKKQLDPPDWGRASGGDLALSQIPQDVVAKMHD